MAKFKNISIIIPTYNEEENVTPLVKRIHNVMTSSNIKYEIIFIDDHSIDKTYNIISNLSLKYPILLAEKKGKKGKSFSIVEGIDLSTYDTIGMIDADLQYPPEAIPDMIKMLEDSDIVVSNRKHFEAPQIMKIIS